MSRYIGSRRAIFLSSLENNIAPRQYARNHFRSDSQGVFEKSTRCIMGDGVSYATLLGHYANIRAQTDRIAEGLTPEDLSAQSMPDASPGKWHLAHGSWFFETFILQKYSKQYQCIDPIYSQLFNSYYESVGKQHARPQRGLITRPSTDEVMAYRQHVDQAMLQLLDQGKENIAALVTVGLHHEMQHQELFLTDSLHLLSHNPMHPAMVERQEPPSVGSPGAMDFTACDGGQVDVGAQSPTDSVDEQSCWSEFSYDCERPRHTTYVQPFTIANRLVTNREWLAFILVSTEFG